MAGIPHLLQPVETPRLQTHTLPAPLNHLRRLMRLLTEQRH